MIARMASRITERSSVSVAPVWMLIVAALCMVAAGPAPREPQNGASSGVAVGAAIESIVVMEVSGRVRARSSPDAEWKTLRENDVLRAGSEVQTGLRSHAALRMGANATILLDAGTTLIIPELVQEGGTLVTRAAVRSGRADIKVDRVGLENDFRVITPAATIAVSGTVLGVQNGSLLGTEVTGARTNALAAIEARWIARRLAYFFGDGTSSARFNDPAIEGWNATVERQLMPGVVSDDSQLEQALVNGDLQNVLFNLNNLQRSLNLPQSRIEDELAIVGALALLLEIRDETRSLAGEAGGAAALAASFAQKAVQLGAEAAAMLGEIQAVVSIQSLIAQSQLLEAVQSRTAAQVEAASASARRDLAVEALQETIVAAENEDWRKAQEKADLASYYALLASQSAYNAAANADWAWSAASKAAFAAGQAQMAIDQYFGKVQKIEECTVAAGVQAALAANAAQAATSLNALAQQIGSLVQSGSVSGLLNEIGANALAATQAAAAAAAARDQALNAASNARTMGEQTLFNWAAVYASQAAAEAALAGEAAVAAGLAAMEAHAAADLAQKIAGGGGYYGKGG